MIIHLLLVILIIYNIHKNQKCLSKTNLPLDNYNHRNVLPYQYYKVYTQYHFQFIGNLYNKDKNIMLKLYGRERIRYVWDYYIIYQNHTTQTKIDLPNIKKKLEHLDTIFIDIFQEEFIFYKNEVKYHYYPYL